MARFMPADAFWTLAMAVNVYLTFYCKFDAQKLRRMEIPYLICCYGVPFVVALSFVFVSNARQGHMYGNATLWCWISPEWDIWRIAMFYGPVWVVMLITIFIYVRAGREIYKKHKLLRNFKYSSQHEPDPLPPMDDLYSSSKTTEVFVTTEIINTVQQPAIDLAPLGRRNSSAVASGAGPATTSKANPTDPPSSSAPSVSGNGRPPAGNAAYSVTIISARHPDQDPYDEDDMSLRIQDEADRLPPLPAQMVTSERATTSASAVGPVIAGNTSLGLRNPATQRLRRRAAYEANTAAWSYTKCAILFFTAMLVTWIPSSANRVFSVVHVDKVSIPLEYMSAFVLPLQGFWNAIIYIVTSWKACQTLWSDISAMDLSSLPFTTSKSSRREQQARLNRQSQRAGYYQCQASQNAPPEGNSRNGSDEMLTRIVGGRGTTASRSEKNYESESVTELALRPSHVH